MRHENVKILFPNMSSAADLSCLLICRYMPLRLLEDVLNHAGDFWGYYGAFLVKYNNI